jgi:hypothetical protein
VRRILHDSPFSLLALLTKAQWVDKAVWKWDLLERAVDESFLPIFLNCGFEDALIGFESQICGSFANVLICS